MAKLADPQKIHGLTDCCLEPRAQPQRRAFEYAPPKGGIDVIHANDEFVVIEKPAGLLSVPGKATEHHDCLEVRVKAIYPSARIVHRLDHATSGVMVVALTAEAHRHLGLQFERRHVQKRYRAIVHGRLPASEGFISLPIRCDWPNRPVQMVDYEHGRSSETRFELVREGDNASEVLLFPVTGRSHQLRLHLAEIGNPILGDGFYGGNGVDAMAPRLLLHAEYLSFFHPTGGGRMEFSTKAGFSLP